MEELAKRLKEIRTKNNITMEKLAEAIGVDHSNISRWENGKVVPSCYYLKLICDYFDVSADYLLGRID